MAAQLVVLILQVILQFCSRFELEHRSFGELNITPKIMRIENGLDVSQAVARERCDLRHAGAGDRQANDRRASQIVKRKGR